MQTFRLPVVVETSEVQTFRLLQFTAILGYQVVQHHQDGRLPLCKACHRRSPDGNLID